MLAQDFALDQESENVKHARHLKSVMYNPMLLSKGPDGLTVIRMPRREPGRTAAFSLISFVVNCMLLHSSWSTVSNGGGKA